jgi:hypothetical protein
MAVDGIVQQAPDSTGKNVANVVITREDGVVIYRQEIVIADADVKAFRAAVTRFGALTVDADPNRDARHMQEAQLISAYDANNASAARRSAERISYSDRRGSAGRGSSR